MSSQSLTTKYRPQRFSDVAGQDAIKRILSKASAEDKIAPAYLFSGTRGVGKTTLARVLAKALNCLTAPTAEPCNECSQCRQITAGVSPDVIEIDAATHGNVEEARRLKEDIGYAPLQSRYKVFIIDEAHMLSKAAFNALLKTLEEPPGRVTFILATTEPHKILPTIISRCQHYVFKRLVQPDLEAHLAGLLNSEAQPFEPSAVSLLARRGAGSVRDSMSLLAQVLAMGGATLTEQDVRDVLGLAGQDVFFSFMRSFKDQDCLGVSGLLRQVLDRGLDIGFFLRELATCWRNLFLLNQAGEKALSTLELTEEEGGQWISWASEFDARHIHACWQMTLEGQRRVMTSLEPALALELLLLNLAYIPKLLSLEAINAGQTQPPGRGGAGQGIAPRPASAPAGQGYASPHRPSPAAAPAYGQPQRPAAGSYGASAPAPRQVSTAEPAAPGPAPSPRPGQDSSQHGQARSGPSEDEPSIPAPAAGTSSSASNTFSREAEPSRSAPQSAEEDLTGERPAASDPHTEHSVHTVAPGTLASTLEPEEHPAPAHRPRGPHTWKGYLDYVRHEAGENAVLKGALHGVKGALEDTEQGAVVRFFCPNEFLKGQLVEKNGNLAFLNARGAEYFGPGTKLIFEVAQGQKPLNQQEMRAKAEQTSLFQEARDNMGAYIIDVRTKN
jgi:DNA polymerase-3 subunit gamma/tau